MGVLRDILSELRNISSILRELHQERKSKINEKEYVPKKEWARVSHIASHFGVETKDILALCDTFSIPVEKNSEGYKCVSAADTKVLSDMLISK